MMTCLCCLQWPDRVGRLIVRVLYAVRLTRFAEIHAEEVRYRELNCLC